MANKRDTAQQKRARQNRAQREALAARTQGGAPKRPSRVAPSTAEKLASKSASSSSKDAKGTADAKGASSTKGARRPRPVRPGDVPVDVDTLQGSWRQKVSQVPGGSQVLMAGIMTVVVTIMLCFLKLFVSEEAQAASKKPKADQTIFQSQGTGRALAIMAIPLVAVSISLVVALKPFRRRVWIGAAVAVGVTVALQVPFYLVVAGLLGFGAYKSSKVEGGGASRSKRRRAQASEAPLDESGPEEDGDPA